MTISAAVLQVVSLNNELMSARAEALSAEEAVLWDLSARLMGVLDDVQQVGLILLRRRNPKYEASKPQLLANSVVTAHVG